MKRKGYGRTPRAAYVFAIRLLPPSCRIDAAARDEPDWTIRPAIAPKAHLPICGCRVRRVERGRIMCRCRAGGDHASHCLSPTIDRIDPRRGRDPAKAV